MNFPDQDEAGALIVMMAGGSTTASTLQSQASAAEVEAARPEAGLSRRLSVLSDRGRVGFFQLKKKRKKEDLAFNHQS